METAVIYFSRSGVTKKAAENMAKIIKADLREIVCLEKSEGFLGFMKAGYQAMTKKEARISLVFEDVKKYDLVIVCSPVWAGNLCSPARAFLNKYGRQLNHTAFILTHGDKKNNYINIIKEMEKLIDNKAIAFASLVSDENSDYSSELLSFAKRIAENLPQ